LPLLDGVRVLDLSRLLPGPACTWYLAGLGAVVDRIEPTRVGDPTRAMPPFVGGVGAFFAALCAGDRSLAADLRHAEAPALLAALLPSYDVLVEGFRPGVLEALGLDAEAIAARFPRLVVARLSGFGQTGPWALRPGHDINYAGLAGVLAGAAPGPDSGPPRPLPVQVADLSGALVAATGISAALYARERTGLGQILDVSLTEAALSLLNPHVATATAGLRDPVGGGEILTGGLPVYGTYRCADGALLTVGALEPKFQSRLRALASDLSEPGLAALFATRPRDAWVEALAEACVGPALAPSELHAHPQHAARGAIARAGATSFVRPPLAPADWRPGPIPRLGEHTDTICLEAGLTSERVAAWRAAGLLG
jgi:alpha-methylacyl-CoA racemase